MIIADDNLLADLDEVDWVNLNHAYGTAADVPGPLRSLCGDDEQAQQKALADLFNHLAHQGTRCQASPYAVPFLARIALGGPRSARGHVLRLLTGLAVNSDEENEIIDGADLAAWRAEAAENSSDRLLPLYEEALATEQDEQRRRNLQDTRDWLAAGNPIDHRDPSSTTRAAVAACLPSINPSGRAFMAKAVLPDLFPGPCPPPAPCTRASPSPTAAFVCPRRPQRRMVEHGG